MRPPRPREVGSSWALVGQRRRRDKQPDTILLLCTSCCGQDKLRLPQTPLKSLHSLQQGRRQRLGEGEGALEGGCPQPESPPQAIRAVHRAPRHHIRLQRGHQSRPRHGPGVEAHARQTEEGPEDRARRTLRLLGPQPSQGPEDVVACDNK